VKQIQRLTVSEKIKFAMRGNNEVRGVLARDTNKLVVLAVLDNPKITESEIEALARNRSIMEEALRTISKNREWMRNYNIQHALVLNPKTPVAISLKLVPGLKKKDMQLLEKNKNVSDALRNMARKFVKFQRS
jgi:pentose-5-phosphate-3-epimerase